MAATKASLLRRGLSILAILVGAWFYRQFGGAPLGVGPEATSDSAAVSGPETASEAGAERIDSLFRDRRSGVLVEARATVEKVLTDDTRGLQHQRFIVRLSTGRTVLIAHNIDLAPRVPASRGDSLLVYGEYEWNAQGGVLHWTHHDPERRRPGGWILYKGKKYE
jgi:hypothetical protein